MEEKRANGADISPATLSDVKVGLIEPPAGIGDPIFWGTIRLVLAAYDNAMGEHVVTTLQTILDSLMPGIVALLMTFACMWLLKLGMNPLVIIIGLKLGAV